MRQRVAWGGLRFLAATSVTPIQVNFPTGQRRCPQTPLPPALLGGRGGRPLPEGQQGLPPPHPLHVGWPLPPLLALGFSNGSRPAWPPHPPGSLTLVFQQDRAEGHPPATRPASGVQPSWGGPPPLPPMPPGTRGWVPGPPPSILVLWRPRLVLPPPLPSVLFCFFFFFFSLLPPSPRIISFV